MISTRCFNEAPHPESVLSLHMAKVKVRFIDQESGENFWYKGTVQTVTDHQDAGQTLQVFTDDTMLMILLTASAL